MLEVGLFVVAYTIEQVFFIVEKVYVNYFGLNIKQDYLFEIFSIS